MTELKKIINVGSEENPEITEEILHALKSTKHNRSLEATASDRND